MENGLIMLSSFLLIFLISHVEFRLEQKRRLIMPFLNSMSAQAVEKRAICYIVSTDMF